MFTTSMKQQSAYLYGDAPTMVITLRAILLCKLQCSTANAISKPPTNIIFVSFI